MMKRLRKKLRRRGWLVTVMKSEHYDWDRRKMMQSTNSRMGNI
jgi:hypothetical protein